MTSMTLKNMRFYKNDLYENLVFIASIRCDSENYITLDGLTERLVETYINHKIPVYHNQPLEYFTITFKKSNSFKNLIEKERYDITFQIQKKETSLYCYLTKCQINKSFEPDQLIDFKELMVKKPIDA